MAMASEENNVIGINGVSNTDVDAYHANYKAHKKGISHKETVEAYTDWAESYDKDLCPGRYNGPEIVAKQLEELVPETLRPDVRVLDVAAGTGRVGENLYKLGFRHIDALEPSQGMIDVLLKKGVYEETVIDSIGLHQTLIKNDTYDYLVISGGMGEGHIPVQAFDEMIRVVKPGGLICVVMREEYLQNVDEYKEKLEPYMEDLENAKKWKRESRTVTSNYSFNKNGVIYVYKVL